jgi:hypothetical protein
VPESQLAVIPPIHHQLLQILCGREFADNFLLPHFAEMAVIYAINSTTSKVGGGSRIRRALSLLVMEIDANPYEGKTFKIGNITNYDHFCKLGGHKLSVAFFSVMFSCLAIVSIR